MKGNATGVQVIGPLATFRASFTELVDSPRVLGETTTLARGPQKAHLPLAVFSKYTQERHLWDSELEPGVWASNTGSLGQPVRSLGLANDEFGILIRSQNLCRRKPTGIACLRAFGYNWFT